MQNKLKINKNYFHIRLDEVAIKHIASRMQDTSLNSFLKDEEVLLIIKKMYNDFQSLSHSSMTVLEAVSEQDFLL